MWTLGTIIPRSLWPDRIQSEKHSVYCRRTGRLDPYFQNYLETIGAEVVKLKNGRVGYKINEDTFVGEQVLGAGHAAELLTKVWEIVRADQGEEVDTLAGGSLGHSTSNN